MHLVSAEAQIFQADPPDGHTLSRGWKNRHGYAREAKELATCLRINSRLRGVKYPLEGVIKFTGEMSAEEHKQLWKAFTKNLRRRGVTAFWIREPSRNNRVHTHLILTAPDEDAAAREAMEGACPPAYRDRLRLHVAVIRSQHDLIHYICKSRVAGYDAATGQRTHDKHAAKRLMFNDNVKLDKYGCIGAFWAKPKAKIWASVVKRERGISLHAPAVYDDAEKLHRLVEAEVSFKYVLRSLAYTAWRAATTKCVAPETANDALVAAPKAAEEGDGGDAPRSVEDDALVDASEQLTRHGERSFLSGVRAVEIEEVRERGVIDNELSGQHRQIIVGHFPSGEVGINCHFPADAVAQ